MKMMTYSYCLKILLENAVGDTVLQDTSQSSNSYILFYLQDRFFNLSFPFLKADKNFRLISLGVLYAFVVQRKSAQLIMRNVWISEVYYRKELHLCTGYIVVIHQSLQE